MHDPEVEPISNADEPPDRDRTIEGLRAALEEARLTLLWQRSEIAARDRRIADLWEQADGLSRTVAGLSAECDALRAAATRDASAPAPGRPRRSLLALASRWRRDAAPARSGPTPSAAVERPGRVS